MKGLDSRDQHWHIISYEKGVERSAAIGSDRVSLKKGVERGPYHWSKVSHEMGVERPHRVSIPDTVGLYVSRERGVER